MKLEVLLSAMFLKDERYIDSLNITGDAVVINQCDREDERISEEKTQDGKTRRITYVETGQRGLSRSRNMAIEKASGDICILCDNDVEYLPDYEMRIKDGFLRHPDADLIVFYIKRKEKPVPNYPKTKRMGFLSVLKIFSPEIAFKRDSVKGIRFDERFGAGSGRYLMGEENIFLYECLKRGLKIYYEPVMIAVLREEESTWFKGYDRDFFISRGANYGAMSRIFSYVLIWQYALRKRGLYKGDGTRFADALRYMLEGRKEFLREG
ncbi:MAG: glycosyltransferase family 2 protein [Lachnospiraceae bacterium]|nr:glycosyltransferase family 2 protein [Lachnospiraceae bacterium]